MSERTFIQNNTPTAASLSPFPSHIGGWRESRPRTPTTSRGSHRSTPRSTSSSVAPTPGFPSRACWCVETRQGPKGVSFTREISMLWLLCGRAAIQNIPLIEAPSDGQSFFTHTSGRRRTGSVACPTEHLLLAERFRFAPDFVAVAVFLNRVSARERSSSTATSPTWWCTTTSACSPSSRTRSTTSR